MPKVTVKGLVQFFLSSKGRIKRLPFFLGELPVIFLALLIVINEDKIGDLGMYSILLVSGFALIIAWAHWMLIIRRLHDMNLSAWFLLMYFIPFINILFLLVLLFKGSVDPNKYGSASLKSRKS